ncbi:MAG: SdrD B-like domain-containing protein [Spirosomataceae bacterium]
MLPAKATVNISAYRTAGADGNTSVCDNSTTAIDLFSLITGEAAGGVWTRTSGTGGTFNAAAGTFTPAAGATTSTFTYTITGTAPCPNDNAIATVTVNPAPTLTLVSAVCSANLTTYTITFSSNGTVTSTAGTVDNTAKTVSGIPAGTNVTLTSTLTGCTTTLAVTAPNCNCPTINPPVSNGDVTICQGTPIPALSVTVGAGESANWYNAAGTLVASNTTSYTPTVAGSYFAEAYNVVSNCKSSTRTEVKLIINTPVNAGTDGSTTVCDNSTTVIDLFSLITGEGTGGVWTRTTGTGGTFNAAAGTFTPAVGATTSTFTYTITGTAPCPNDEAIATVNISAYQTAGTDGSTSVCDNSTTAINLFSLITGEATGGVWTRTSGTGGTFNAAAGTFTPAAGATTSTFTYTITGTAPCPHDESVVTITVYTKPNAGQDQSLVCANDGTAPSSTTLVPITVGGSWTQQGTLPTVTTVTGNSVTGMTLPGTYGYVYSIAFGNQTCSDTIQVVVPACDKPVGSIGDLVWKDQNDNGLQDLPSEKGVAGVKVNLYAAAAGTKTGPILQTQTTNSTGLYLFGGLVAGNYIVEIDKTTLPDTCRISNKPNTGTDDTKDSDFDPITGLSQVITLNPVFTPMTPAEALATNNLTVDAGLVVPCVASTISTNPAICSADVQTYSFTFSVTNRVGIIKVNRGTLSGNNPYTVVGVPSGQNVRIVDSLSAICKFETMVTGPNCNCNPTLPQLLTPSLTACIGDTFPTLKAMVMGLATVEWYDQPTGGTLLFTGLNFKPSGTVPAGGKVFYAQARSTDPSCPTAISSTRASATVNAQNCTKEVDLALKKSVSKKIAQIGDILTYTLKVWNESNTNATGVSVTDSIATTVQFVAGSFVASRGSATITGNVISWNIGPIAANGDTVTLTYQIKVTQEGVHFNTAEICTANEKDVDSTPCNHVDTEDDIDRQCFTVPFKLCPGEKVEASVPSKYTNVQWFRNGSSTSIASGNVVMLSDIGAYTYTATNQNCPMGGCCPVIIEPGTNCCPAEICVPFTIKKRRK